MWAIIAVYWIHPIHLAAIGKDNNDELTIDFGECGRRCRAWRSVWDSVAWMHDSVSPSRRPRDISACTHAAK